MRHININITINTHNIPPKIQNNTLNIILANLNQSTKNTISKAIQITIGKRTNKSNNIIISHLHILYDKNLKMCLMYSHSKEGANCFTPSKPYEKGTHLLSDSDRRISIAIDNLHHHFYWR